jgi:hypothetical protein
MNIFMIGRIIWSFPKYFIEFILKLNNKKFSFPKINLRKNFIGPFIIDWMFLKTSLLFFCLILFVQSEINIPENFSGELLISSRQKPTQIYKALFQKTKSDLKVISSSFGSNEQFFYHNGKMMKNSKECIPQEEVPPFEDFSFLMKKSKKISGPTLDKEVNKCQEKYSFSYAGEFFVICFEKNVPTKIIGRNVLVQIQMLKVNLTQQFKKDLDCPEISKQMYSQEKLAWYQSTETCLLGSISDSGECNLKKIKIQPTKDCIFFHGSGEVVTGEPIPEHPEYWGKIHEFTPHCKTRQFIREETKIRGWDSADIQRKYCLAALKGQENKFFIQNKIIYTHSMGALILSGAIKNRICEIDSKTTTWYTMASSFEGTKIIPFVKDICEERNTGILPSLKKIISEKLGYCRPGKKELWPAYETLNPNNPHFGNLSKIAEVIYFNFNF